MFDAVYKTDISEFPLLARGKVRDIYDLGDRLLIIATDRISAFDWILPNAIPGKGLILNSMSLFWFAFMRDIIPNHVMISEFDLFPGILRPYRDQLKGRSMIVRKARRIDIECVARGYLVGSGFADYKKLAESDSRNQTVDLYDNELPANLRLADRLPLPIFTPASKAETGHDQNIPYGAVEMMVGRKIASMLRDATLTIYARASAYAITRGIIVADTKLEFGFIDNKLTLIDEILSPDSSRFWPVESYAPGTNPPSFDKQFIRDWLESSGWDKNSPPPELPQEVVAKTLDKYKIAHRILVGTNVI